MSEWAETGLGERWRRLHPGWRTAAVFAGVAVLSLAVPNTLVEGLSRAFGLPRVSALLQPPIGYAGRAALALLVGWLAAVGFAVHGWSRERAPGGPLGVWVDGEAVGDDPLRVEPLAAARDLGARFDESPYLAPPPPTPDARLDPDSTLAEPKWRAGAAEAIVRTDDWDREVQAHWEAQAAAVTVEEHEPSVAADSVQPGNAAEQWDGPAEVEAEAPLAREVCASLEDGEEPVAGPVEEVAVPVPVLSRNAGAEENEDEIDDERSWADLARRLPVRPDAPDEPLPTTAELLDRLTRAAVRRAPRPAPPRTVGAADPAAQIAEALGILREAG